MVFVLKSFLSDIILLPQLSFFHVHVYGIFFAICLLSAYVNFLFRAGFPVDSICMGHASLPIQLMHVLGHLIYLHSRLLLIGTSALLVGLQTGAATMENSMEFPQN